MMGGRGAKPLLAPHPSPAKREKADAWEEPGADPPVHLHGGFMTKPIHHCRTQHDSSRSSTWPPTPLSTPQTPQPRASSHLLSVLLHGALRQLQPRSSSFFELGSCPASPQPGTHAHPWASLLRSSGDRPWGRTSGLTRASPWPGVLWFKHRAKWGPVFSEPSNPEGLGDHPLLPS